MTDGGPLDPRLKPVKTGGKNFNYLFGNLKSNIKYQYATSINILILIL